MSEDIPPQLYASQVDWPQYVFVAINFYGDSTTRFLKLHS
jgi:hypothetical protein